MTTVRAAPARPSAARRSVRATTSSAQRHITACILDTVCLRACAFTARLQLVTVISQSTFIFVFFCFFLLFCVFLSFFFVIFEPAILYRSLCRPHGASTYTPRVRDARRGPVSSPHSLLAHAQPPPTFRDARRCGTKSRLATHTHRDPSPAQRQAGTELCTHAVRGDCAAARR